MDTVEFVAKMGIEEQQTGNIESGSSSNFVGYVTPASVYGYPE